MPAARLALTGVSAWIGRGDRRIEDATIVIHGGRFAYVGPSAGASIPPDTRVIDARGTVAIPGLCDLHTHLTSNSQHHRVINNTVFRTNTPPQAKLLHGLLNGLRALSAGFTTLRVMGNKGVGEVHLRDFINQGILPGPRLLVAPWWISMTAGHGDLFWPPTWRREPDDTADGPDECREAVRRQVREGADFIKIMASGGVMSHGDKPTWPNYTVEEISAITDEAHALGLRVAAHAQSTEGIRRSLLAGVDTIEHGIYLDDACIELMLKRGVTLVPTLAISTWIATEGLQRGAGQEGVDKIKVVHDVHRDAVRRAHEAGVKIALGTDSSGTLCPFGENARELELYVEVGMSPVAALEAGTRVAAEAMGLASEIGTLEVGKRADLVLVNGDPTRDIGLLRRPGAIRMVLKDGVDCTDPWPAVTRQFEATELQQAGVAS